MLENFIYIFFPEMQIRIKKSFFLYIVSMFSILLKPRVVQLTTEFSS